MRMKKSERVSAIAKIVSDNPNRIFTLGYFADMFSAAKSTISEDILSVKNSFEKLGLGKIITLSGAAGGMKYIPLKEKDSALISLNKLCDKINEKDRTLIGGFLYMIDITYDPQITATIGELLATAIDYSAADYVVTIETKGIPMALMTARAMNLPLLTIRKNARISEGPSLGINYVTENNRNIQSMSLPRKSLKSGAKVILIDDFMRGGGTFKGMINLMKEFEATVVAKAVLVETQSDISTIEDYISLITIREGDGINLAFPSQKFIKSLQNK
ncbi:MAG: pur operon repressor [Filifactoraceae bacterium]